MFAYCIFARLGALFDEGALSAAFRRSHFEALLDLLDPDVRPVPSRKR